MGWLQHWIIINMDSPKKVTRKNPPHFLWIWCIGCEFFNILSLSSKNIILHRILLKIRRTRLKHPQDLDETTPHDHEHEKKYEALTYGWIIDMFSRFTDRDMSSFVNVFVEFGTSIAEAAWCWLEGGEGRGMIIAVDKIIVGKSLC